MEDDIEPYYQSGISSVEHRDLDASGDGHPFGDEPKSFKADLQPLIRELADDLYESWEDTIREYLANAETACLKVQRFQEDPSSLPYDDMIIEDGFEPKIVVTWDRAKQKLIIQDNGIGMAAVEVDEVFRHIGRSAARDIGAMTGSFGLGALSFDKFIGHNQMMTMTSHSRLNDDNASYLVTLAGIEPIMGQLDEEQYGTKFELDQKHDDMDIRKAVERYAESMRVPVLYYERNENGKEVFNEDWGDKRLYDSYDDESYANSFIKEGFFEAYCSPDATGKTLLLSMDIERNGSSGGKAPHPFDIRLLDESGRVVKSESGNEGLIPVSRHEYEKMLLNARSEYITERLCSSKDVVGYKTKGDSYDYAVEESVLESDQPLPRAEYVPLDEGDGQLLGEKVVIIGPNQGRKVVSEDDWSSLPEGRAAQFVPEDELGDTDICLPQPTTNRSSLQENDEFWEYIANYFVEEFDKAIEKYRTELSKADNKYKAIDKMEPNTVAHMKETRNNA